ncbi:hypothetical protein AcW1_001257 [Taiwanofungus camphoratus]|nr:hypothetical protein AcW2_000238 [Antrodia cinnamomea]KAI0937217.1 hypothetical protein AcV5_005167 [Antrodia cinnamomea]KAI0962429.1 hypothetical protein AcV7_001272 [Antrodia cinnamomea]KAI0964439.1 hypothetical protein AcW1_001257 [Antrodia cinnamomea]
MHAVPCFMVIQLTTHSYRELQKLIDASNAPSSPFHSSHAATTTDPTIYPPPGSSSEEPEGKKRKRTAEGSANGTSSLGLTSGNDLQHARYPNLVLANKHLVKVHADVKKECEHLAELCVSVSCRIRFILLYVRTTQDKVKLWVNLSMPKIEEYVFSLYDSRQTKIIFSTAAITSVS